MQHPPASDRGTISEVVSNGRYSPSQHLSEIDELRQENQSLRSQLTKLSEASFSIIQSLDLDSLLQEVVESAGALTGARYAVLLTYDGAGNVNNAVTSGISAEQIKGIGYTPEGLGLLGYLNEVNGPVRIADISTHPRSIGFPKNHPPMKTFLGMRISHQGEHVGNLFLTEKLENSEFTPEDEEVLVMFAALAAQAISNARRYQEVNLARTDMETLVDISPMGVGVYDAKSGVMISYNQEMRRIVGVDLTVNDVEPLLDVLSFRRPDGRPIPLPETPVARVMMTGETVRAEEIIAELPDGRSVTTLVNAAPIFAESGEISSVVVAVQDMSPLQDLEKVRAEFLGMVSQELRVPLATVKGSTAALMEILKSVNPTETLQFLRIIDQQADLMRSQINSLIELSQIEAGTLSIYPELSDVSDLVETASGEFQRSHTGTAIDVDVPSGLPLVMADKERITLVLNNLFSEASRISSTSPRIRVSASSLDIYVVISVSCDSEAFPGETFVGRSIHPPENGSGDTIQDNGGQDLAFAFCRGIVEVHGGRIRAERGERGYGMVYTFTLPAADESMESSTESTARAAYFNGRQGNPQVDKAKILVVVPDGRTLGTMRRILSDSDFTTITATDPAEIDRVVQQERPNMVLLDLSKSEQAGMRLTQRLASDFDLPVIVLSERGDDNNVARAFEIGADDYLVKPFSPTELVARIKSSLRKQSAYRNGTAVLHGYAFADVSVNYDARTLNVSASQVPLTATEYKLLYELSSNAGRILTQDELLHRVWGPEYSGEPQLLRSYIKSLRQKLGDNARNPSYIFTEHGIGYRMAKS